VHDALVPGKRLYCFSTGTGFAPFASVVRDPETYEKFDEVIVTHTCREVSELTYSEEIVTNTLNHEFLGELAQGKLRRYASCTRESYPYQGRITDLIRSGKLFEDLGVPSLNPYTDRVMICGSMDMLNDTKQCCIDAGLEEGSNAAPSQFVIEKAFAG
tara:strand:+ start:259 stop:732 length:474 start_codon:yes stop_codon:yes gene_type:complete